METKYFILFEEGKYFVSEKYKKGTLINSIDYDKRMVDWKTDKLNGVVMRYNYTYYGAPIPKDEFEKNVPENWEKEYCFISGYSYGGYKAELVD